MFMLWRVNKNDILKHLDDIITSVMIIETPHVE